MWNSFWKGTKEVTIDSPNTYKTAAVWNINGTANPPYTIDSNPLIALLSDQDGQFGWVHSSIKQTIISTVQ